MTSTSTTRKDPHNSEYQKRINDLCSALDSLIGYAGELEENLNRPASPEVLSALNLLLKERKEAECS